MSVVSRYSQLFDSNGFTDILPFDQDNLLAAGVQSDHAEIALRTPGDRIINIWNISNPAYHCYFKYGDKPPFHKTHLFVERPFVEGVLDEQLSAKIDSQTTMIAERFVQGAVNIQVIVEGFEAFYQNLADKIIALGHQQFQIISLLNEKPENWRAEKNVTALLIDTSRFSILDSGVISSKYAEAGDGDKERDFSLPYAHVRDTATARTMVIAGVHTNGCDSQYPKTGLETLVRAIEGLRLKTESDVIAAGDYNTPVMHAKGVIGSSGVVLKAPYPTHVNPKCQVANYDQVSIFPCNESEGYEMLAVNYLSTATQHLVGSIEMSRQRYLAMSSQDF